MEIEGLGARCHLPTCRTIDYLPFRCSHCTHQYCREHHLPSTHACPKSPASSSSQVPTCPLCQAAVPVPATMTPDQAVSRHIDAGCPKRQRANPVCAKQGCSKRDIAATNCATCKRLFCLEHRLEMDHDCIERAGPVEGRNPFGQRVTVEKKTPKVRRAKGEVRVEFFNGMANAIGDTKVDEADRVRVAVFFPMGSGVRPRYMFFSQKNSAGKIIDSLQKDIKELDAPSGGARYCLYAVKKGGGGVNLLPHITPLKDLPREVLGNGDILVLEEGEEGLDRTWFAVLAKWAGGSSTVGGRKPMFGKKKGITSKADKCAVS